MHLSDSIDYQKIDDNNTNTDISTNNIIVQLPDNRVEPNDKLSKYIFNLDNDVINARCLSIVENRNRGSPNKITTLVTFTSDYLEKLDSFDREVAMACFSIYTVGNAYTTDEQIYRVMIGNPKARLRNSERTNIENSLIRLMSTVARIDLSGLQQMGYKTTKSEIVSAVLPVQFVTNVKVNNSYRTVIKFLNEPPLITVAKIKNNQFITYKMALANVGGRNSPELIAIKNYVLRRIQECKLHPQLTRTVTFKDIFEKNGLSTKNKVEKKRYRDFLVRCFDDWKFLGLISNYEMRKKGSAYHGISFQLLKGRSR